MGPEAMAAAILNEIAIKDSPLKAALDLTELQITRLILLEDRKSRSRECAVK